MSHDDNEPDSDDGEEDAINYQSLVKSKTTPELTFHGRVSLAEDLTQLTEMAGLSRIELGPPPQKVAGRSTGHTASSTLPGGSDVYSRRFIWTGTPNSDSYNTRSPLFAPPGGGIGADVDLEARREEKRPADTDILGHDRAVPHRVRMCTRSVTVSVQEEARQKLEETATTHAAALASTADGRLRQKMMQQTLSKASAEDERVGSLKLMVKNALKRKGKRSTDQLGTAFRRADMDRSGALDFDEFRMALTNYGLSSLPVGALHTLFRSFDVDGSGDISYEEFVEAVMNVEDPSLDERASRWARAVKPRNPLQAIKRTAFEVNPPFLELGELPLGRTYRCALRIRNAGDTDVRTRVWLEPPHLNKNRVRISAYPRGPIAAGLKAYIEVEVLCNAPGALSCTVMIKSGQKLTKVPLTAQLSLRKMSDEPIGAPNERVTFEHPARPWPLLPEMWEHTVRETNSAHALLDKIEVLRTCSPAQKKEFAARMRRTTFKPGEVLIRQGDDDGGDAPARILFMSVGEAIVVLSEPGAAPLDGPALLARARETAEIVGHVNYANDQQPGAALAPGPPGSPDAGDHGSLATPATPATPMTAPGSPADPSARPSLMSREDEAERAALAAGGYAEDGHLIVRKLTGPFYVGEGRLLTRSPASATVIAGDACEGFALCAGDAKELFRTDNQTLALLQRDVRVREFERETQLVSGGLVKRLGLRTADVPTPEERDDAFVEFLTEYASGTRYAQRFEFYKAAGALSWGRELGADAAEAAVADVFTTFIERVDGTRPPGLGNALTDELVRELKQRRAKAIADRSARELQKLFAGKLLAEAERVVTKYVVVGFVESEAYQKWLTVLFPYPDGVEVSLDHTMKVHRRRSVVPVPAGAKMLMGVFDDACGGDERPAKK